MSGNVRARLAAWRRHHRRQVVVDGHGGTGDTLADMIRVALAIPPCTDDVPAGLTCVAVIEHEQQRGKEIPVLNACPAR